MNKSEKLAEALEDKERVRKIYNYATWISVRSASKKFGLSEYLIKQVMEFFETHPEFFEEGKDDE